MQQWNFAQIPVNDHTKYKGIITRLHTWPLKWPSCSVKERPVPQLINYFDSMQRLPICSLLCDGKQKLLTIQCPVMVWKIYLTIQHNVMVCKNCLTTQCSVMVCKDCLIFQCNLMACLNVMWGYQAIERGKLGLFLTNLLTKLMKLVGVLNKNMLRYNSLLPYVTFNCIEKLGNICIELNR